MFILIHFIHLLLFLIRLISLSRQKQLLSSLEHNHSDDVSFVLGLSEINNNFILVFSKFPIKHVQKSTTISTILAYINHMFIATYTSLQECVRTLIHLEKGYKWELFHVGQEVKIALLDTYLHLCINVRFLFKIFNNNEYVML